MIQHLREENVLQSPHIIEAFENIDRADFVLKKDRAKPYGDYPLSIGYDATISQPYTVAFMLELLQAEEGNKILDIGAGSGWTSGLLAHIAGKKGFVYGVEIIPELVEFARTNLKQYPKLKAKIFQVGEIKTESEAPFDRIMVSASAQDLPKEAVRQLAKKGTMVIPIQNSLWKIYKNEKGELEREEFPGFAFVPLR
ncbi:MAG: protein-L-isoaspartate O-methyltransferase [Candidatus Harrisonbacteria bacterium]|nr:protein-L-isoaspartate O-methyltransferase [Candidatus Harrisonbacteria bacterium]